MDDLAVLLHLCIAGALRLRLPSVLDSLVFLSSSEKTHAAIAKVQAAAHHYRAAPHI